MSGEAKFPSLYGSPVNQTSSGYDLDTASLLSSSNFTFDSDINFNILSKKSISKDYEKVIITVKSRSHSRISERVECKATSSLRKLRRFIVKSFPFLPNKFVFMRSDGANIEPLDEASIPVSTVWPTVYIKVHIPETTFL